MKSLKTQREHLWFTVIVMSLKSTLYCQAQSIPASMLQSLNVCDYFP